MRSLPRLAATLSWMALAIPFAAAPRPSSVAAETPAAPPARVPWTASKFRGTPEPPPPYRVQRIYPQLQFTNPTCLTSAPGGRLFVAEQGGKIFALPGRDDPQAEATMVLDARGLAARMGQRENESLNFVSVYGLTFHPQFETNHYCYVCYVVGYSQRDRGQHPRGTRVSRFELRDTPQGPQCDLDSELLIIDWLDGGHNGGCLKFGPDGCLYISTGDGGFAFPPDGLNSGQDVTNLLSAILRIDVDHPAAGAAYRVPPDNPLVDLPKARGEIYAYGLRNPWKMSFDRQTGDLWVGDVGWELWELVYRVRKGDNFGWSLVEGSQVVHTERERGPTPIVPPTVEIPHTDGASVTGGFVYRGRRLPELQGTYVFGDWETRRIWGVSADADSPGPLRDLVEPTVRIVGFAEDADGELLLLDYDDGSIFELHRNDAQEEAPPFPRKLSESGLFVSTAEHQLAPGVIPFEVNSPQWADHATAERALGLPGADAVSIYAAPRRVAGSMFPRTLDFPQHAVLIKTLSLEMAAGKPESRRRIETQVLHHDGRFWRGYSYAWNDEQTDAELVEAAGMTRELVVADPQAPESRREQTWRFASRVECMRCHNPWAEHTLGFNVRQLNREAVEGNGAPAGANQLQWLREIGAVVERQPPASEDEVSPPPSPPTPVEELPQLAPPFDSQHSLDARARSYLHANCAHCHRDGGGGSAYLHLETTLGLSATKALGARPTQGLFGIFDARILAPGDPSRSVLYYRMATTGPGRMPHIGSRLVDSRGLDLIHQWIRQLPPYQERLDQIERLKSLSEPAALAERQRTAPERIQAAAERLAEAAEREAPNEADLQAAREAIERDDASQVAQRARQREELIAALLETTSSATVLLRAVSRDELPEDVRQLALDAAAEHGERAVAGLFESYVPTARRRRRLGESVTVEQLSSLTGRAAEGAKLFWHNDQLQCRNCHQVAGKGKALGPDLTQVGRRLNRSQLVESILDPSRNIDPKFATWTIETEDGEVATGMLLRRTETEMVLVDAKGAERSFARERIERAAPQRKSLMPELQFRDLTAQEAADLLAYLESLK